MDFEEDRAIRQILKNAMQIQSIKRGELILKRVLSKAVANLSRLTAIREVVPTKYTELPSEESRA